MAARITPLDPDSEKGREVAERLSQVLAEIFVELDNAKAAAAPRSETEGQEAA